MSSGKHLVIIRTRGSIIDYKTYNCQEIGIAKALTDKGWKVSVILAGEHNDHHIISANKEIIDLYYLTYKGINRSLSWFDGLSDLLTTLSPDIIQVHEFGTLMSFQSLKWAKNHNKKCVLIQGNYDETHKPIFRQLEQMFNNSFGRYILKNVDGVGYKTKMASRYVKKYYNKETFPTQIGLDITRFENRIIRNWRAELNIKDKKVLLYIGKLESRRNPELLLKIIKQLPPEYVLLIVGAGDELSGLKQLSVDYELVDRCIFLGKLEQEELPALYSTSDLFLLMSDYEIYGMVILESMFFGLPVISTLTAGSEVLIDNNINGVILETKDTRVWSDSIKRICDNNETLTQMKKNATYKINQELTWDKVADLFITLYQNA